MKRAAAAAASASAWPVQRRLAASAVFQLVALEHPGLGAALQRNHLVSQSRIDEHLRAQDASRPTRAVHHHQAVVRGDDLLRAIHQLGTGNGRSAWQAVILKLGKRSTVQQDDALAGGDPGPVLGDADVWRSVDRLDPLAERLADDVVPAGVHLEAGLGPGFDAPVKHLHVGVAERGKSGLGKVREAVGGG